MTKNLCVSLVGAGAIVFLNAACIGITSPMGSGDMPTNASSGAAAASSTATPDASSTTTAGVSSTDAAAADDDSTGSAELDPAACAHYIDCVAAVAPAAVGEAVDNYGPEGSCWTPETVDICIQACIDARRELMMVDPDEMACWDCATDEECTEPPNLTCEPIRRICGESTGISGVYLLAVDRPGSLTLQFIGDVTADIDSEGNGLVDLELRSLSLDLDSNTEPREEIGFTFAYQAEVSEWEYVIEIEDFVVLPEADAFSAEGFLIDAQFVGSFASFDAWCGETEGSVVYSNPYNGEPFYSTFAAIRLDDRDERPIDTPVSCREL